MIAVMGATGNTGRPLAAHLLDLGERVRALSRSPERLRALVDREAEAAVGDPRDAAFLTDAFHGTDAVYAMVPPEYRTPGFREHYARVGEAIARAARDAGVRRVVLLSSIGADVPSGVGPVSCLHHLEERMREIVGLDLLVLRPGYFFENHFATIPLIKQQGINSGAFAPDVALVTVAAQDVGEKAAEWRHRRDFRGAMGGPACQ
jgi:uncharacterized protein YbjT (DUF2867 family)